MGWLGLTLGIVILVAVVVVFVRRSSRPEPPTDSEAEDFLTEYFALEEFDDEKLRERLEHLRGVPELR